MTIYRKDLSPTQIRDLLDYEPATGLFTWRARVGEDPSVKAWNTRFAGELAGTIDRRGYRRIKIHSTYYAGHRLAWIWMTGEWPPEDVDHINLNKGDNRFSNLRLASRSENQANVPAKSHNKLGIKGVCWKPAQGFHAQIKKNGKVRSLGHYKTAEEAHAAYVKAATEVHGEFARAV